MPCEQSGDHGTHEYLPPRAKTGILFIQCKVHANEKQGHPMDLFLKISVLQANVPGRKVLLGKRYCRCLRGIDV